MPTVDWDRVDKLKNYLSQSDPFLLDDTESFTPLEIYHALINLDCSEGFAKEAYEKALIIIENEC